MVKRQRKINENGGIGLIMLIALALIPSIILFLNYVQTGTSATARLNQSYLTKTKMLALKSQILQNTRDIDGDGFYEPLKEQSGNVLPASTVGDIFDEWGATYLYCTWDLGSANTNATYSQNNTSPPVPNTISYLISSGRNKSFETACSDTVAKGDDILVPISNAEAATVNGAGQMYDIDTKLLMHFDNNLHDSSLNTSPGYHALNTSFVTTSKFGTGALSFNGTSSYLYIPDINGVLFNLGYEEFTIDFWTRIGGYGSSGSFILDYRNDTGYSGWCVYITNTGTIGFYATYGTSTWDVQVVSPSALSLNTWYHIAIVRMGNTFTLYVNGTSVATQNFAGYIYRVTWGNIIIGRRLHGNDYYYLGYLDELRISKGVARWKSGVNFTPPTSAYTLTDKYKCVSTNETFVIQSQCRTKCGDVCVKS